MENNASQPLIAIDIGGSLAKVVYWTRARSVPLGGRVHFCKFETTRIDECITFLHQLLHSESGVIPVSLADYTLKPSGSASSLNTPSPLQSDSSSHWIIKATGGGAHKFHDILTERLGVLVEREDEMECLITGLNFLVTQIPYEVFTYDDSNPTDPMIFQETPSSTSEELFPYLLVNIGSGVSIIKVTGHGVFQRVSGTSLGGGTLWGLLSLLTQAQTFDDMLAMSKRGDNKPVDMLVGDIYGSGYEKIGLKSTTIASTFGKVFKLPPSERFVRDENGTEEEHGIRPEDIACSLLYAVSNNIGQIAYLTAQQHGVKRIYFGGCFIRGHSTTMKTLSYAIQFWSRGAMKALFLRHEGYLGSLGAFLKYNTGTLQDVSFMENFVMSGSVPLDESFSTATDSLATSVEETPLSSVLGVLDRLEEPLAPFPLLNAKFDYKPDTIDLQGDPKVRAFWLDLFDTGIDALVQVAVTGQGDRDGGGPNRGVEARGRAAADTFRHHLKRLREAPSAYGILSTRALFRLRELCLREYDFDDIYARIKRHDNAVAVSALADRLQYLDNLPSTKEKFNAAVSGLMAGNLFDWGSAQVMAMLSQPSSAASVSHWTLEQAMAKIQRPLQWDQSEKTFDRLTQFCFRGVCIFVDNSGSDVVLGVLPLVRLMFQQKWVESVILAANTQPSLNDITARELEALLEHDIHDPILRAARQSGHLKVFASGSASPCVDLRRVARPLVEAVQSMQVNLVLLVGMGRAVHTNWLAKFQCDAIKACVVKSEPVAQHIGCSMYDGIWLHEMNE